MILFDSLLEPLQEGFDYFKERCTLAFVNLQQSSQAIRDFNLFRQVMSGSADSQVTAGQSRTTNFFKEKLRFRLRLGICSGLHFGLE